MGILDDLLGGGQRQKEYKDFVTRYEQGSPADGYSDQEVIDRYSEVAHAVPIDQYSQAAEEALARMSPQEREALVRLVQERAKARGVAVPTQVDSEPGGLSRMLADLHRIPGQLRDLFTGDRSAEREASGTSRPNIFSSPLAKAALAGITAIVARRVMQGR